MRIMMSATLPLAALGLLLLSACSPNNQGTTPATPRLSPIDLTNLSVPLPLTRIFDIRDPHKPREVAYFNAPVSPRIIPEASNWAMSSPSFVPERKEIWYSDGYSGFYAIRVTNNAWPDK